MHGRARGRAKTMTNRDDSNQRPSLPSHEVVTTSQPQTMTPPPLLTTTPTPTTVRPPLQTPPPTTVRPPLQTPPPTTVRPPLQTPPPQQPIVHPAPVDPGRGRGMSSEISSSSIATTIRSGTAPIAKAGLHIFDYFLFLKSK
jgi:hypothetical protein